MDANSSTAPPVHRGHVAEIVNIGIHHWPVAITTVLLLLAGLSLQNYLKPDSTVDLPRVGDPDLDKRWTHFLGPGSWEMYKEGYNKYIKQGKPFKMTDVTKRDRVVLPHTMLPELARIPEEVLSGPELAAENNYFEYTMRDSSTPVFKRVLMSQLTPSLFRITGVLQEEVVAAMTSELPESGDWTETTIHDKLLRIVSMSMGRVFVGPEACREPTWIEGSTTFVADLARAGKEIGELSWFLRPLLAPRLESTKCVRGRMQRFADILEPIIRKRKQQAEEQGTDYLRPDDMTQWMIDSVDKIGQKEVMDIALEQTGISFSAVNSTTQHTSLAFFSLAAHPELGPVLLEDVKQALEHSGGEWTNTALHNMKKLDSFLKEVGRCTPFTAFAFARKVMTPITLSNGMHIPKNTVIEVDWHGITQDPEVFPEPEKFDALRYYNLRTDKEWNPSAQLTDGAAQFANISTTNLTWNYGRRACPGRFFAANMIKLMFATLLLQYEVRNVEGVDGRVDNVRAIGMQATNPENKIQIRRK